MTNVNDAIKERIKQLLKEKGMTLYCLSKKSGLNTSTLNNIMRSDVKNNKLSTAILIASGFEMTVSEFLDSSIFLEENLRI